MRRIVDEAGPSIGVCYCYDGCMQVPAQALNCDELLLLNDRVDRMETYKWQGAERQIRLIPLWQWLEK